MNSNLTDRVRRFIFIWRSAIELLFDAVIHYTNIEVDDRLDNTLLFS